MSCRITAYALLLFLLTSCMVDEEVNREKQVEQFTVFDAKDLEQKSSEIVGSGRLLAPSTFRSLRVNAHWVISGLFPEKTSQFILHAFFDHFDYDTGIQIRFSQDKENERDLKVEFAEPQRPFRLLTVLKGVLASDHSFRIRIETRNKTNNQKRILIWNDSIFTSSTNRKKREKIFSTNADYDSLRSRENFYSWGSGLFWGATIEKMRINELKREAAYDRF